jgi:hypothetical protein
MILGGPKPTAKKAVPKKNVAAKRQNDADTADFVTMPNDEPPTSGIKDSDTEFNSGKENFVAKKSRKKKAAVVQTSDSEANGKIS